MNQGKNYLDKLKKKYPKELYLFLSVDLVGSTKEKFNAVINKNTLGWLKRIRDFYKKFETPLSNGVKRWKYLGDEVLFYAKLDQENKALQIIQDWLNFLKKFEEDEKLKVRSHAWIGGFPVNNFIIKDDNKDIEDFIGPQIDIGFRLSKFSTYRKFIVSIDLAYMLSIVAFGHGKAEKWIWHYEGRKEIKGYPEEENYPLVWIDREKRLKSFESKEEEITGIKTSLVENNQIKELSQEFFEGSIIIHKPFIEGSDKFSEEPPNYKERYVEAILVLEPRDSSGPEEQEKRDPKKEVEASRRKKKKKQ